MLAFVIKNDRFFQVKFYKKTTILDTESTQLARTIFRFPYLIACLKPLNYLSHLGYLVTYPIFLVQGWRYFQFHVKQLLVDV